MTNKLSELRVKKWGWTRHEGEATYAHDAYLYFVLHVETESGERLEFPDSLEAEIFSKSSLDTWSKTVGLD